MDDIPRILSLVTTFVRLKYKEAAMAAGISKTEFRPWAEAMAHMGVATAYKTFEERNEEMGSFLGYAIFRTKDAIRSSLREEHRYRKATEAIELAPVDKFVCQENELRFYLLRDETKEILEFLSADQRTVLALDYEGYSVNEIASITKRKSVNTVKSLLRRARLKSRQLYWQLNGKSQRRARDNTDDDSIGIEVSS